MPRQSKVKLDHQGAQKPKLDHQGAQKVKLDHQGAQKLKLDNQGAQKLKLDHQGAHDQTADGKKSSASNAGRKSFPATPTGEVLVRMSPQLAQHVLPRQKSQKSVKSTTKETNFVGLENGKTRKRSVHRVHQIATCDQGTSVELDEQAVVDQASDLSAEEVKFVGNLINFCS